MSLEVYSAQMNRARRDPNFLDVSRASGTEGIFMAPSWQILSPALAVRREAAEMFKKSRTLPGDEGLSLRMLAEIKLEENWNAYEVAFIAEMEQSQRINAAAWEKLLDCPRVVLGCYCAEREQCHTALLRVKILPSLGAIDKGELQ